MPPPPPLLRTLSPREGEGGLVKMPPPPPPPPLPSLSRPPSPPFSPSMITERFEDATSVVVAGLDLLSASALQCGVPLSSLAVAIADLTDFPTSRYPPTNQPDSRILFLSSLSSGILSRLLDSIRHFASKSSGKSLAKSQVKEVLAAAKALIRSWVRLAHTLALLASQPTHLKVQKTNRHPYQNGRVNAFDGEEDNHKDGGDTCDGDTCDDGDDDLGNDRNVLTETPLTNVAVKDLKKVYLHRIQTVRTLLTQESLLMTSGFMASAPPIECKSMDLDSKGDNVQEGEAAARGVMKVEQEEEEGEEVVVVQKEVEEEKEAEDEEEEEGFRVSKAMLKFTIGSFFSLTT
mmetsp:Transcript_23191/g.41089  ORF Transcript_23191/g.41089 Transcript_23191/m.41089 type:complete len:347 (+) Transcript_23191:1598-2638(+)